VHAIDDEEYGKADEEYGAEDEEKRMQLGPDAPGLQN